MSRYLRKCAKGFCFLLILWVSLSCDFQTQLPSQQLADAQKALAQFERLPPTDWPAPVLRDIQRQVNELRVVALLVSWALAHPQSFSALLEHIEAQDFRQRFAQQVALQGKSFVFIERFATAQGEAIADLLKTIRQIEQQDHRTKVTAHQLSQSASLTRVARLTGEFAGVHWQGAAFLLAQSECQLGLATAGHNVIGMDGALRAPLANLTVRLDGIGHALVEVVEIHSPAQPEQDWTLVVADKVYCGKEYPEALLGLASDWVLPEQGLAVSLFCYHQGRQDVMPSLYKEQCRIYPTDAGVLDYYADKSAGQLGIHTCFSQQGSSGCPILFQENHKTYFLATQIEGDRTTGAGIARLLSDEFAQALADLRQRFAADDAAYRLTPLGRISAGG